MITRRSAIRHMYGGLILGAVTGETLAEEAALRVYGTGIPGVAKSMAVSPDGNWVAFSTDAISNGIKLMDLSNGHVVSVPSEKGRVSTRPSWSRDGRHLVLISAAVKEGYYDIDDAQVKVLNLNNGVYETLTAGKGARFAPRYARDGKSIYFQKGQRRISGKTAAANYDLFSVRVGDLTERQLTGEGFYSLRVSGVDTDSVYMSGTVMPGSGNGDRSGRSQNLIYRYNIANGKLLALETKSDDRILDFYDPVPAGNGDIFAIVSTYVKGPYQFHLARIKIMDGSVSLIKKIAVNSVFDYRLARKDIVYMESPNGEIVLKFSWLE